MYIYASLEYNYSIFLWFHFVRLFVNRKLYNVSIKFFSVKHTMYTVECAYKQNHIFGIY